jgi:hypothetical protein
MRASLRLLLWFMVATALLGSASAAQAAAVTSSQLMARCARLYGMWFRYEQHPTYHHTGQRARAELALYGCEKGQYDAGIEDLERMLQRGRISVPPAGSTDNIARGADDRDR